MNGSELIAKSFVAQGLRFAFGLVGVPVTSLAVELQAHGIAFVGFRNEQAASYGASIIGYLTTGQPALCLTVAGPGMVHALAGVVNAQVNCWPLILLSAGCDTSLTHKGAFQEAKQIEAAAPYVKYAARVERLNRLPFHIEQAVRVSRSGRPGPCYLEIPGDLLLQVADAQEVITFPKLAPIPRSLPDEDELGRAWAIVKGATRPLVVIGRGAAYLILYAGAEPELREFVDTTGIPFLASPMGKGVVPDDHALNVGPARSLALANADVVLLVGSRLNWMFGFGASPVFSPTVNFIQMDIDPAQLNANVPAEVALLGDLQLIFRQFNNVPRYRYRFQNQAWLDELRGKVEANRTALARQCSEESVPLSYHRVLKLIDNALPRDAVIVNEGANTMDFGRIILNNYEPRSRLDAGTMATMGVGLGYAIAAAIVHPKRKVVAVQGDSAFGFSGMEVEVAVRYQLPITFIVLNNNGIYAGEEKLASHSPTTLLPTSLSTDSRYEKIMEAFGGKGYFVRTSAELAAALAEAITASVPSLINVMIRTDGPIPKVVQAKKH